MFNAPEEGDGWLRVNPCLRILSMRPDQLTPMREFSLKLRQIRHRIRLAATNCVFQLDHHHHQTELPRSCGLVREGRGGCTNCTTRRPRCACGSSLPAVSGTKSASGHCSRRHSFVWPPHREPSASAPRASWHAASEKRGATPAPLTYGR